MDYVGFFVKALVYIMPAYIANSSAMILGGKTPLDFGKIHKDGKPILGKGKTWKGTFGGIIAGTVTGVVIQNLFFETTQLISKNYFPLSVSLAVGAMFGDIIASFYKRRYDFKPGEEAPFLDQLDFVVGAMILGMIYYVPSLFEVIVICFLTLILHRLTNWIAYKWKMKKVPW